MAKVKIFLDKDETMQEAEESLFKALNHHSSGDVHEEESFADPAMTDLFNKLQQLHKTIYAEMLMDINDVLDQDYIK